MCILCALKPWCYIYIKCLITGACAWKYSQARHKMCSKCFQEQALICLLHVQYECSWQTCIQHFIHPPIAINYLSTHLLSCTIDNTRGVFLTDPHQHLLHLYCILVTTIHLKLYFLYYKLNVCFIHYTPFTCYYYSILIILLYPSQKLRREWIFILLI